MNRMIRETPYRLITTFVVASTITGMTYASVIEPDFTTADPELATSLKNFVSKPGPGPQNEGKSRTFTVEPAGFTSLKNDTEFDIADLHLNILTDGVTWGDANGDGEVFGGQNNFYLKRATVSADKKSITLDGGLIKKGKAFDPLFDVKELGEDGVSIRAYFSVVPEPSALSMLIGGAAALFGFAGRRVRQINQC